MSPDWNVFIIHRVWVSRGQRRQMSPKTTLLKAGILDEQEEYIPVPQPYGSQPLGQFSPSTAPAEYPPDPVTHLIPKFAFWAVTGSAGLARPLDQFILGFGKAFVTIQNPPPHVLVGNDYVFFTAWYIVDDSNAGPGVIIDAFDVDLGTFVLDDFVTVSPEDASGTLTTTANATGFVATQQRVAGVTTDVTEDIIAFDVLPSDKVPFGFWQVFYSLPEATSIAVSPGETKDLVAAGGSLGIAFAFYQSNRPVLATVPIPPWTYDIWWKVKTHGGLTPPGPTPSWTEWMREFAAALALTEVAGSVSPEVRRGVLESALQQMSIASESIKREMKSLRSKGK